MPRTYLTLEEKEKAKREREIFEEDSILSAVMHQKIDKCKGGIGYERLGEKTKMGTGTLVKVINHPSRATVKQLRAVCDAVGISLTIVADCQL